MSAYYYLYTAYYDEEKGEYKRIDPYFRNKEGKLVQTELVWSGSRSYFSDTWDKLNEIANDTYSKEIKGIKGLNLADFRDEETDYATSLFVVSFDTLREYTPESNRFEQVGFKMRTSDDEDIKDECGYLLTPEEYSQLDDEAKKCYEFYEFDSYFSWQYHFKYILERLRYVFGCIDDVNEYGAYKIENVYLVGLGGW